MRRGGLYALPTSSSLNETWYRIRPVFSSSSNQLPSPRGRGRGRGRLSSAIRPVPPRVAPATRCRCAKHRRDLWITLNRGSRNAGKDFQYHRDMLVTRIGIGGWRVAPATRCRCAKHKRDLWITLNRGSRNAGKDFQYHRDMLVTRIGIGRVSIHIRRCAKHRRDIWASPIRAAAECSRQLVLFLPLLRITS